MASTVVVDSSDGSRSPLHSPTRQNGIPISLESRRRKRTVADDFGKYEIGVLLTTQLSYIPIACTMLSTSFYKPTETFCAEFQKSNSSSLSEFQNNAEGEFRSLLIEWDEGCSTSIILASFSSIIMLGALVGAFSAGWLADVYGRKPVVRGCLIFLSFGNLIFSFVASFSWYLTALLLFVLGMACGGYMVTNLVLLVECLESPNSRLLSVSLNGWSISMVFVALIAYISQDWFFYHLAISALALVATFACQYLTFESCRWLASVHRLSDAKLIASRISLRNGSVVNAELAWHELLGFHLPIARTPEKELVHPRRYGYSDLFSFPSVYKPLISLCYCFVASSIVSFGFYFVVDMLPGDRYSNMGVMGLLKFSLGLLPFLVSPWMGRKPIATISLVIACIALWTLCFTQFFGISPTSISVTLLSILVAAALDPTWKILHLYSAELFPTVVRNMARGICNVGARLGSVAAPMIVHLRLQHYLLPFIIFAFLLSIQLLVVMFSLPETKNRPLPDRLLEENEKENGVFTLETVEINNEL
ncbi:unnamed protein product [Auanema sp. JU1783]|nr:unnamed protein product [Auanema sp. JU1783]